ncbi:hypothetical protein ACFWXT_29685 [Bacillus cereus]|uniref:hypothetical protein n=1 Tax=Bacillus cereus TaxID=1396 RepID=UPI00366D438F
MTACDRNSNGENVTDRDTDRELLQRIARKLMEGEQFRSPGMFALKFIDAIVEAAWRPPARVIDNYPDLDALPVGAIVIEADTATWAEGPNMCTRIALEGDLLRWSMPGDNRDYLTEEINLPAIVVWRPEEARA